MINSSKALLQRIKENLLADGFKLIYIKPIPTAPYGFAIAYVVEDIIRQFRIDLREPVTGDLLNEIRELFGQQSQQYRLVTKFSKYFKKVRIENDSYSRS
jgi:hypothetical protein